jgi:hypothetical protein
MSWSGLAAVGGTVLWMAPPWVQLATLGTRPYLATPFDVVAFAGWILMATALWGVAVVFGRVGCVGVGLQSVGMFVIGGLLVRRITIFVAEGVRAVPATGESPAGLVLTWAFLLGYACTLAGAGLLGVGLWRLGDRGLVAGRLLVGTPPVVAVAAVLGAGSILPQPVGATLVRTNVVFLPFAAGWVALGHCLVAGEDGTTS